MKALILAAALVAAGAASTPVFAQEADVRTEHVSYRDVDFGNSQQVRSFYARLRMAAQRVCNRDDRSLGGMQAERACERNALDLAVAQVNRQELYALHGTPSTQVAEAGSRGH